MGYLLSVCSIFSSDYSRFEDPEAPWIDSIGQTTLGGQVLRFEFLWTDVVCYSVGTATRSLEELWSRRFGGPKLEKVSGSEDLLPLC